MRGNSESQTHNIVARFNAASYVVQAIRVIRITQVTANAAYST